LNKNEFHVNLGEKMSSNYISREIIEKEVESFFGQYVIEHIKSFYVEEVYPELQFVERNGKMILQQYICVNVTFDISVNFDLKEKLMKFLVIQ